MPACLCVHFSFWVRAGGCRRARACGCLSVVVSSEDKGDGAERQMAPGRQCLRSGSADSSSGPLRSLVQARSRYCFGAETRDLARREKSSCAGTHMEKSCLLEKNSFGKDLVRGHTPLSYRDAARAVEPPLLCLANGPMKGKICGVTGRSLVLAPIKCGRVADRLRDAADDTPRGT